MIGPFGRQGPVATVRQLCPQMTQRHCKQKVTITKGKGAIYRLADYAASQLATACLVRVSSSIGEGAGRDFGSDPIAIASLE